MKKRNPFDIADAQTKQPRRTNISRPDADIRNADWPKRTADVDADGNTITPKVVKPVRKV